MADLNFDPDVDGADDDIEEEEADEEIAPDDEEEDDEQQEPTDEDPEVIIDEDDDAPAAVYLPQGDGAAASRLKEHLADPETFALVQAMVREETQRSIQANNVTQSSFNAAAAEAPELFRKYGGKINMVLATFPEAERHTRKAVDIAAVLAATEHKAGTKEFAAEILKVAQQLNGKAAAPAPRAPKAPIPAEQRPPSPAAAGRGAAPRESRAAREMASRFGIKGRAFEDLQEDLSGRH